MVEQEREQTAAPELQNVVPHLEMVQGIVARMAQNSAMTKTWCVTLVAAILVLVARTSSPYYALIGLLPTIVFCFMDTYYLASERSFRDSYNSFVARLHRNELQPSDIFLIHAPNLNRKRAVKAFRSWAVWPFYATVAGAVIAVFFLTWFCT